MKLEVLVKYARPKEGLVKKLNEEDDGVDERGITRAQRRKMGIDDDDEFQFEPEAKFMELFDSKNLEYFYKPYVIDTREVHDFAPFDEEHVMVMTEWGGNLPIKMSWPIWKATWEHYTGEVIQTMQPLELKNNQKQL